MTVHTIANGTCKDYARRRVYNDHDQLINDIYVCIYIVLAS